jgi:hypothetical protein
MKQSNFDKNHFFSTLDDKICSALKHLLELIEAGQEYPDAIWKVSYASGVSSEALGAAYDQYCGI